MEDGIKEESDECISKDDLISFVTEKMTDRKKRQKVRDHLQWCIYARRRPERWRNSMNRNLSEEIADCYRRIDLAEIEVPKDFLEKFFPRKLKGKGRKHLREYSPATRYRYQGIKGKGSSFQVKFILYHLDSFHGIDPIDFNGE